MGKSLKEYKPLNYDVEVKRAWLRNVANFEIDSDETKEAVRRYALKNGFTFNFIYDLFLNDTNFQCRFIKDPAKQGIHQKSAAKYIENTVENIVQGSFMVLPSNGKKALYIYDSKLVGKDEEHEHMKSIDFRWECQVTKGKILEFYATHKYTKENGGAQDNQFADVQDFLKEARNCKDDNKVFVAITDGDYYLNGKYSRNGKIYSNKLEFLNKKAGDRNFATTVNKLDERLQYFLQKEQGVENISKTSNSLDFPIKKEQDNAIFM